MQSGIASLPTSCSGAAWRSERDLTGGQPEPEREPRCDVPDALGVLIGLVVAILGGDRQLSQRLRARVVELPRALGDQCSRALALLASWSSASCWTVTSRATAWMTPSDGEAEALHSSHR